MLEQSVTVESVIFPCCPVPPVCGIQHAELGLLGHFLSFIIDLPLGDRSHISEGCSFLGQKSKFMRGREQKTRKGRTGGNKAVLVQSGGMMCQAVMLPSNGP